jgi:hypothetical protein
MLKYLSNRQKNLKLGIVSYTDNETVLEVAGNVGIKTSDNQGYELYVSGDTNISGIVSASAYYGSGGNLEDIIAEINLTKIEGIELKDEGISIGSSFTSLNFAGSGVILSGSGSTATITVETNLNSNQDFGSISKSATSFNDFESINDSNEVEYDFGVIITTGIVHASEFLLPSYSINTLPSASPAGKMLFVTDETGGSVPAFSDGFNWRRITDRQIVS